MTTNQIDQIVEQTQQYYDGAANEIYREIWGENLHLGIFAAPDEPLQAAMERSNRRMSEGLGLARSDRVLDVGGAHGALGRYLAQMYGCQVLVTDISVRELAWGRELTADAGMEDRVTFQRADFHDLPFEDDSFDCYWSQEAFLHAADKARVLREAHRVLTHDGKLVFSDLLVRRGTSREDRQRIYERVLSPDMWDTPDYVEGLRGAGFDVLQHEDWSENVAPTYSWVRKQLEARRPEFERRIGKEAVDRTSAALQFWVDSAHAGKIGWEYFVATP